ncbi:hypothetical protein GCM10007981_13280 [Thermocladium modestius]|uniref:Roadblock/LAMTOR2 domain-containing protein n=1 Tax=Thermocladium modestius TaxID=62609 RepID=A0A830GWJ1_9CREN|nr:hypothetical protein GCM10007981_13280 [Thermocladium modestius]
MNTSRYDSTAPRAADSIEKVYKNPPSPASVSFDSAINGLNTMLGQIIEENKEYISGLLLLSRDGSLLAYRTNGPVLNGSDADLVLPASKLMECIHKFTESTQLNSFKSMIMETPELTIVVSSIGGGSVMALMPPSVPTGFAYMIIDKYVDQLNRAVEEIERSERDITVEEIGRGEASENLSPDDFDYIILYLRERLKAVTKG